MSNVNLNLLKGKIVERGLNISALARVMNMPRCTLYRKLQNPDTSLTIKNVNEIVKALRLTEEEAVAIFFDSFVA